MAKTFWSDVGKEKVSRDGRIRLRPKTTAHGRASSWSVEVDGKEVWQCTRLDSAKQYGLEYRDGLHRSYDND
jgi:hypothetical protein